MLVPALLEERPCLQPGLGEGHGQGGAGGVQAQAGQQDGHHLLPVGLVLQGVVRLPQLLGLEEGEGEGGGREGVAGGRLAGIHGWFVGTHRKIVLWESRTKNGRGEEVEGSRRWCEEEARLEEIMEQGKKQARLEEAKKPKA